MRALPRALGPFAGLLALLSPTLASTAADPGGPAPAADPWATMRGCEVVLWRFNACAADKKFRPYRDRWVAAGSGDKKLGAEIARRLKAWTRADGRRAQCAAWARREGAAQNVGESSPLSQLAARGKSVPCQEFAQKIDEGGWLPAALVDPKIE